MLAALDVWRWSPGTGEDRNDSYAEHDGSRKPRGAGPPGTGEDRNLGAVKKYFSARGWRWSPGTGKDLNE